MFYHDFSILNSFLLKLSKSKPADLNESMSRINETLFGRLKSCILLQVKYKEVFRNLRDALGGNQALSNFPSVSSALNPDLNNNMSSQDTQSSSTINYSKKIGNRRNESMRINGILIVSFLVTILILISVVLILKLLLSFSLNDFQVY